MTKKSRQQKTENWQQAITDELIAMLEKGVRPWSRSWSSTVFAGLPRRSTGEVYKGFNSFWLSMMTMFRSYSSPYWMTFNQAKALGGMVRKGERSTQIVKYGTYKARVTEEEADAEETKVTRKYLKTYNVFNASQIDGLSEEFYENPTAVVFNNPDERRPDVESFIAAQLADIRYGGERAYYSPADDFIQVPEFKDFRSADAFYATLIHELVHWTKPAHRCDRDLSSKGTMKTAYALEEVCAELGASFLSGYFGFNTEEREDHAAYIEGWLKALKNDKKIIFKMAALSQHAVDWMLDRAGLADAAAKKLAA